VARTTKTTKAMTTTAKNDDRGPLEDTTNEGDASRDAIDNSSSLQTTWKREETETEREGRTKLDFLESATSTGYIQ
jgi:hypothetical protein